MQQAPMNWLKMKPQSEDELFSLLAADPVKTVTVLLGAFADISLYHS